MAVRTDFTAGEVLAAADLNDTFASKLDLAGGKILQIVRATDGTDRTTTSGTYVDVTGMTVTITPQKSDSAVIIICDALLQVTRGTSGNATQAVAITDSSNNVVTFGFFGGTGTGFQTRGVLFGYNTPATTSATTYKVRHFVSSGATSEFRNAQAVGQVYAIEVSA